MFLSSLPKLNSANFIRSVLGYLYPPTRTQRYLPYLRACISKLAYYNYLFKKNNRKEPGVRYAVNETFDDVRDEDIFQNEATTKIKKEKQVLLTFFLKVQILSKLSVQCFSKKTH